MSGYEQDVDQQYLNRLQGQITEFVQNYNANPPPTGAPTLIFFPGGLGSRLIRATEPAPDGPNFDYYTVWLNCTIVLGVLTELEMVGDQDWQDEYILPDGVIDFIQTYDGSIQWCEGNNLPLFIYGWDWRRKSGHAANFFLSKFLPAIDAAVAAGNYALNPLNNFWLIGHSFGGMVVKRILNETKNGDKGDAHLSAVGAMIARIAALRLRVRLRLAFELCARDVVEQHVVVDREQRPAMFGRMRFEGALVRPIPPHRRCNYLISFTPPCAKSRNPPPKLRKLGRNHAHRVVEHRRRRVLKFNAQGPDGLVDREAPGQPLRLNEVHRRWRRSSSSRPSTARPHARHHPRTRRA